MQKQKLKFQSSQSIHYDDGRQGIKLNLVILAPGISHMIIKQHRHATESRQTFVVEHCGTPSCETRPTARVHEDQLGKQHFQEWTADFVKLCA